MELNEYQKEALKSAFFTGDNSVIYAALGLAGETGEFVEQVKKGWRDDEQKITEERREAMIKELGDILWYLSLAADMLMTDLDTVATVNLEKIKDRENRNVQRGSGDNR